LNHRDEGQFSTLNQLINELGCEGFGISCISRSRLNACQPRRFSRADSAHGVEDAGTQV